MNRIRDKVYVLGAGFSKGCGYPLTSDLLVEVWSRLDDDSRSLLQRITEFHHPRFDSKKNKTFPNIEKLLTEITVNLDLFASSRRYVGNFQKEDLVKARLALLNTIADWFHNLYKDAKGTPWLKEFVKKVREDDAGVISFNWDLLLDHQLFGESFSSDNYGLGETLSERGPIILKPHGSLNWYKSSELMGVKKDRKRVLYNAENKKDRVSVFSLPRSIKSKAKKQYAPIIVAPTYLKDFNRPIFERLWKHSTELLSTASEIIFLGYSLPDDDLQARYILRCGFHNQIEGMIVENGRSKPTGRAKVIVVNPDEKAIKRIEGVVDKRVKVEREVATVEQWMEKNR